MAQVSNAPADSPIILARVKEHMPLVTIIGKQLARELRLPHRLDDLLSSGREGLLKAVRAFDEERGVPLVRYINLRVRGAMLDSVRKDGILPRKVYQRVRALEAACALSEASVEEDKPLPTSQEEADKLLKERLEQVATAMAANMLRLKTIDATVQVADEGLSPEEAVANDELRQRMHVAIEKLPASEKTIIRACYINDQTIEEAARGMGLSKSWGSRLHARAISMLTQMLRPKAELHGV